MLADYPLFDAHLHIIDPRFPLIPNNGFLPEAFTYHDYLTRMVNYNLCGGAIVSGSCQGFDQSYLIGALKSLGTGFVGVTQLPLDVSEQEILDLNSAGVRAIRFNLYRGGSADIKHLNQIAQRVYELANWHVELYLDSTALTELHTTINSLPKVSIDHLGLSKDGFAGLLKLVELGVQVKASGFSRGDLNIASAISAIYSVNPEALMFATDLPSTRAPVAYSDDDFSLIIDCLGESAARQVFFENAMEFYQPNYLN